MMGPLTVDIGICTFRRRSIRDLLMSLRELALPDQVGVRVLVADNDMTPSAREAVEAIRADFPHELEYIHAPACNISIARNACLAHCRGAYIAFIDDDEIASRQWLMALLRKAEQTGAAAVLGPVMAQYPVEAPEVIVRGEFHSTRPVISKGKIRTGYTCNLLLDCRHAAVAGRQFDPDLGACGGEDTAFLAQIHAQGGTIVFAPDALVVEPVPRERMKFRWLSTRRFRSGQSHARLLISNPKQRRFPHAALAAMKACWCAGACVICAPFPVLRWRFALRAILHLGVLAGLLGVKEKRIYGILDSLSSGSVLDAT